MITLEKMLTRSFRESVAWQAARVLTLAIYQASSNFPRLETFGLTNDLRRCAAAVGANIAEGYGRNSWSELRRFAQMANGSLEETKNFLVLAADLGFLEREDCERLLEMAEKTGVLIAGLDRRQQQELFPH